MNNSEYGQEQFIVMISKENNIAHYLISTPFSALNNLNYGNKLLPELFEKEFLVYDGLMDIEKEIIEYLKDISQNTVLITGYQGCGKTTFVNYLVEHLKEKYITEGKTCGIEKIDFEKEDEEEEGNPFKQILLNVISDQICDISSSSDRRILNFFINNYYSNKEAFNIIEDKTKIQDLFDFLVKIGDQDFNKKSNIKKSLIKHLKKLKVPQILTMWSYFVICKEHVNGNDDFVEILLLDNIDDIYKNEYTEKFIRGLKKYHELGSLFISKLKFEDIIVDYNLYTNFNFIFCLRDTSAAKFSYHFTTRAVEFFHRDISEKVDKKEAINQKLKYLENVQNEQLNNRADIIKHICNDQYTIRRIFPLYNNDYRTAVKSLCNVLSKNERYAREYCRMTETENSAAHFGAHGIVLRLILNSFEKQDYFKAIGSYNVSFNGEDKGNSNKHDLVDYSIPRIILTYLYNYQEEHKDSFLNNLPDTTVNLKKMYDDFYKIIAPSNIADKLDAMYALHLKQDWNHLININATYDINSSNLNSIFKKYEQGKFFDEEDGSIIITCAGRVFVQRITTHYEYFACRYFEDSIPLFLDESLLMRDGVFVFDKNINDVLEKVTGCVQKAYEFDLKIIREYYNNDIKKFKQSHYLFKKVQTHAERIINHNISYIDAFRHYIIKRAKSIEGKGELSDVEKIISSDKEKICEKIINHINKYVTLMKIYIDNNYFSNSAKNLYEQYTTGIQKIGTDYLSEQIISFEPKKGE